MEPTRLQLQDWDVLLKTEIIIKTSQAIMLTFIEFHSLFRREVS
jgi:hypothetical protein